MECYIVSSYQSMWNKKMITNPVVWTLIPLIFFFFPFSTQMGKIPLYWLLNDKMAYSLRLNESFLWKVKWQTSKCGFREGKDPVPKGKIERFLNSVSFEIYVKFWFSSIVTTWYRLKLLAHTINQFNVNNLLMVKEGWPVC